MDISDQACVKFASTKRIDHQKGNQQISHLGVILCNSPFLKLRKDWVRPPKQFHKAVLKIVNVLDNRSITIFRILLFLPPGGVYFLVKDYWGCAAGWGRIFTTGLTIMGLHF